MKNYDMQSTKHTILLLDDDLIHLLLTAKMLYQLYNNINVVCFENSNSALEYLNNNIVDIIIQDVVRPESSTVVRPESSTVVIPENPYFSYKNLYKSNKDIILESNNTSEIDKSEKDLSQNISVTKENLHTYLRRNTSVFSSNYFFDNCTGGQGEQAGFRFFKTLRSDDRFKHIPIIFATGVNEHHDYKDIDAKFMWKPFMSKNLNRMLEAIMPGVFVKK